MLHTSRHQVLDSLRQQLRGFEKGTGTDCAQHPQGHSGNLYLSPFQNPISTGIAALDGLLPWHGLPPGGMVEWLTPGLGTGAALLALAGVRAALQRSGGWWVVIDPRGDFFPLAVAGWGIPMSRLVLIRPGTIRDAAWAFEQALRCPGVSIAWHWPETTPERMLQRWKIAAEVGQGQGVLFRSSRLHKSASWADVRWLVQPLAGTDPASVRRLRLDLAYCRGLLNGHRIELECDDETGSVRVAAPLAGATTHQRQARA